MIWDRTSRPLWLRCTIGVILAIIAAAIRLEFLEVLELRASFLTFYPAVAVAALYGGLEAGLLATAVSAALADYFWMEPVGQFGITNSADLIGIVVFLASGTLISYLAAMTFRSQARAHKAEEQLKVAAERKQAEALLQRQAELLHLSYDAIIVWQLEGIIESWNKGAEELYGYSQEEAEGQVTHDLLKTVHPEPRPQIEAKLRERKFWEGELKHRTRDGREVIVSARLQLVRSAEGVERVLETNRDITERKRTDMEREVTIEILKIVNQSSGVADMVEAAATFFQHESGCEAVGIRLNEGEDFPYSEAHGFPEEFVRLENSLCAKDAMGNIIRDSLGSPVIECMCGNVILGRVDPSKPFFSPGGSFWANDTTRLLATTSDEDRQTRTRNRCNGEGYESVALIPLRLGTERLGLIQLNDRRTGMFSAETIAVWERLADHLAVAVAKYRAEEALRDSEAKLSTTLENLTEGVVVSDTDGRLLYWNRAAIEMHGFSAMEECLRPLSELADKFHFSDMHGNNIEFDWLPLSRIIKGEKLVDWELRAERTDLEWQRVFSYCGNLAYDGQGNPLMAVVTISDITEGKRAEEVLRESERLQQMLARMGDLAARTTSDAELIEGIGAAVAGELGVSRCGLSLVDVAGGQVTVAHDYHSDLSSLAGSYPMVGYADYLEDGLIGRTVMFDDVAADPRTAAFYEAGFAPIHVRAHLTVPLLRQGQWVANFWVSHHEPHPWTAAEAELMRVTADRVWTLVERRRVEAAVRESEERFRVMANSIPQLAWIARADGYIYWYNQRWYEYTGTTPEQMEGWGWQSVHDLDALPGVLERWKESIASGEPFDMVFPLRGVDGNYRQFLTRVQPVQNAAGEVIQWCGTNTDITERKQAEARLTADLAALTRMHALSGRLLATGGLQPLLQEIMDAAVSIVGAEKGTLQLLEGDSLRIVAAHGHQQPFLDFFASAESQASVCGEATRRGERIVVLDVETSSLFIGTPSLAVLREAGVRAAQSTPMMSRNGALLGILTTQWGVPYTPDERDLWRIDLLVRQAADLINHSRAEETLRENEATLRAALASIPDAVFISDVEGLLVNFNDAFVSYHRFRSKDECSRSIADCPTYLEAYMADGHPAPPEMWAIPRALRGETVKNTHYTLQRKDTGEKWTGGYSFSPIRDKDEVIIGSVVVARDITEQQQMKEELRKSRDELELRVRERTAELNSYMTKLEQSNQALQDFASIASHDMKEPLRKVISFGNMLRQKCGDSLGRSGNDYLEQNAQRNGADAVPSDGTPRLLATLRQLQSH